MAERIILKREKSITKIDGKLYREVDGGHLLKQKTRLEKRIVAVEENATLQAAAFEKEKTRLQTELDEVNDALKL